MNGLTITGCSLEKHYRNLNALLKAAKQDNVQQEKVKVASKGNLSSGIGNYLKQRQTRPGSLKAPLEEMAPPMTPKELEKLQINSMNGLFGLIWTV